MGYTKIVQSGDLLEVYKYSKNYVFKRKRDFRRAKRRQTVDYKRGTAIHFRSVRSISRAKKSFFRLVSANLPRVEDLTFFTFTCHETLDEYIASLALKNFFLKIRKKLDVKIDYIAVPEWQENGNIHFHAVVWGVDRKFAESERSTRNFQRCWARGFLDVRYAASPSVRIATYMAKYLVKGLADSRLVNRRAYSCSRGIVRPTAYSNNEIDDIVDLVLPDDFALVRNILYDVPYLGECSFETYNRII